MHEMELRASRVEEYDGAHKFSTRSIDIIRCTPFHTCTRRTHISHIRLCTHFGAPRYGCILRWPGARSSLPRVELYDRALAFSAAQLLPELERGLHRQLPIYLPPKARSDLSKGLRPSASGTKSRIRNHR